MEYLRKTDIIFINQKTIKRHGGNFIPPKNFLNAAPLDYLIEVISSEMFGEPLYPKVSDKAGLYLFNIISNHVFSDGNKRTGLGAALLFLRLNGYQLKEKLMPITFIRDIDKSLFPLLQTLSSNEVLEEFVLETAKGEVTLEECQTWFKENIIEV